MGFQLQSGQPTIQGELERGLAKFTGTHIRIRGASRTDSGAHAEGQVVDFLTTATYSVELFPRALNHYLPEDIRIQAAYQVPAEFNSRKDAISRTYRYQILNRPWPSPLRRHTHLWLTSKLHLSSMAAAAQRLVGLHDFRWFTAGHPLEKSAIRQVLRWDVWREGDTIFIQCEGSGFMRHQIRRANSLLIEIGKGHRQESDVTAALEGSLPDTVGSAPLPAHGLCLIRVNYAVFPPPLDGTVEAVSSSTTGNGYRN